MQLSANIFELHGSLQKQNSLPCSQRGCLRVGFCQKHINGTIWLIKMPAYMDHMYKKHTFSLKVEQQLVHMSYF